MFVLSPRSVTYDDEHNMLDQSTKAEAGLELKQRLSFQEYG